MVIQNMCFICTKNSQYVNNRHSNKQQVNSENWCLYQNVTDLFVLFCFQKMSVCIYSLDAVNKSICTLQYMSKSTKMYCMTKCTLWLSG